MLLKARVKILRTCLVTRMMTVLLTDPRLWCLMQLLKIVIVKIRSI